MTLLIELKDQTGSVCNQKFVPKFGSFRSLFPSSISRVIRHTYCSFHASSGEFFFTMRYINRRDRG